MAGVLLNQVEAAEYLGVSTDLIRRWTRSGSIPTWRDHDKARVLYPRPALDAFWATIGTDHARKAAS